MTQEEQDAVLGRTIREYEACKKELNSLSTKLASVGEMFQRLAATLKLSPETVIFEGVSHDARFGSPHGEVFFPNAINGGMLVKEVTDLQNLHVRLDELRRRLKSLGHDTR